jgi:zinc-ribbon domain
MQQDRYCRSCGQELRAEDQFCANCGRPVHATAHVPTPEADVSVPPPQQAEDHSVPSQAPQAQSSEEELRSTNRGPTRAMLVVFLVLGIGVPVQEMPAAWAGKGIGDQIINGVALGIAILVIPATLILLLGGVYYVTARKQGVTLREAIFNWPLVIVTSIVAFLILLPS